MLLKTIYIARHGYRSNWLPPPHPDPPTGIDSDPALLEHGEQQAVELANYIMTLPAKPQMIVSSPFYRCIQTSEPVSKLLGLPVLLDRGLGEWFKIERDTHPVPGDLKLLSSFFNNLDMQYEVDKFVVPLPLGESELDIFKRCQVFWQSFIPYMLEHYPQVETVLLVTHALTKIALGMSLMGYASPRDVLELPNVINGEVRLRAGACSLDKFEKNDQEWHLKMNGNFEFLTDGEEMNWNFEHGFEAGSDEDILNRKLNDDKYDEFYLTLDIPSESINNNLKYYNRILIDELSKSGESELKGQSHLNNLYNSSSLQYSGLDQQNPLFLINKQIYQGEYKKLNGTELIVNDNGDVMGKSKDRILLHKGDFHKKQQDKSNTHTDEIDKIDFSLQNTNNSLLLEKLVLAKKFESV